MAERPKAPTVVQKLSGLSPLGSMLYDSNRQLRSSGAAAGYPFHTRRGSVVVASRPSGLCTMDLGGPPLLRPSNPVFVAAPAEKKGAYAFAVDFLMGGVSAAVSKTDAAPIERVKLLIQNQDEMRKSGRLQEPYKGIDECFKRTISEEGFLSLYRSLLFLLAVFKTIFWQAFRLAGVLLLVLALRRMMMTSGEGVKYSGSLDCFNLWIGDDDLW